MKKNKLILTSIILIGFISLLIVFLIGSGIFIATQRYQPNYEEIFCEDEILNIYKSQKEIKKLKMKTKLDDMISKFSKNPKDTRYIRMVCGLRVDIKEKIEAEEIANGFPYVPLEHQGSEKSFFDIDTSTYIDSKVYEIVPKGLYVTVNRITLIKLEDEKLMGEYIEYLNKNESEDNMERNHCQMGPYLLHAYGQTASELIKSHCQE